MSDAEPQNFATSASMSPPTRPASSGADPSKTKWAVWIPIIVSISGLVGETVERDGFVYANIIPD